MKSFFGSKRLRYIAPGIIVLGGLFIVVTIVPWIVSLGASYETTMEVAQAAAAAGSSIKAIAKIKNTGPVTLYFDDTDAVSFELKDQTGKSIEERSSDFSDLAENEGDMHELEPGHTFDTEIDLNQSFVIKPGSFVLVAKTKIFAIVTPSGDPHWPARVRALPVQTSAPVDITVLPNHQ